MRDIDHRAEATRALDAVEDHLTEADEVKAKRGATYTEENYLTRAAIWANVAIAHALLESRT